MESIVKSVNPDNGFSFAVMTLREPSAGQPRLAKLWSTHKVTFGHINSMHSPITHLAKGSSGSAAYVGSDEFHDGVAVAFAFGGADAGDALEFVERGGR
jgi:hypothetical protein